MKCDKCEKEKGVPGAIYSPEDYAKLCHCMPPSQLDRIESMLAELLLSSGAIAFNESQLSEAAKLIGYPCRILAFTSDDLERIGEMSILDKLEQNV